MLSGKGHRSGFIAMKCGKFLQLEIGVWVLRRVLVHTVSLGAKHFVILGAESEAPDIHRMFNPKE
jgi:hypothetical protein